MIRPARIAARSGLKGDSPAAIRSTLTKSGQSASFNKYSRANVVLPAPLGPATIMIRRFLGITGNYSLKNFSANLSISQLVVRLMLKGVEFCYQLPEEERNDEQCTSTRRHPEGGVYSDFRWKTRKVGREWPTLRRLGDISRERIARGSESHLRVANQWLVRTDHSTFRRRRQ